MKINVLRIISMGFLIAALAMFVAMNFLPLMRSNEHDLGWKMWPEIWLMILNPANLSEWSRAVGVPSLLTFSLLIVASPFLGNVWVKSFLAWSIAVVISGVAAAGFWLMVFNDDSTTDGFTLCIWCLMISPVLNFVGLVLARPQWLKKSGVLLPPGGESAV